MRYFTPVLIVLLAVVISPFAPEAQAQIEVTESDLRSAAVGDRVAIQRFEATSPSSLSPLFNQSGDGATFDFTSVEYELVSSGFRKGWNIENAPQDIPSLSRFADRNANVVLETQFQAQEAAETDSTVWQFLRINSSEQSLVHRGGTNWADRGQKLVILSLP